MILDLRRIVVSVRCGWSGKLPASGDFLARRIPAEFSRPWEQWLETAIGACRSSLGARWQERFRSAPAWRFVLAPGVLSRQGWTGVMLSSADRVGRCYLLTLVRGLGAGGTDAERTLEALGAWLDALENLAAGALSPDTDPEAFDAAVAALAPPLEGATEAAVAPARSAWAAARGFHTPGWRFSVQGTPGPQRYCEMLAGQPVREATLP